MSISQPFMITTIVSAQNRSPVFCRINEILISLGTALCFLGIRIVHHNSPHASYPLGSNLRPLMVLIESLFFSMAIWNRNIIVLLIAVGVWSGGFALHVRSTSRILNHSYHCLILCSRLPRFDNGEISWGFRI
jgi:uncharacterized membrane protein